MYNRDVKITYINNSLNEDMPKIFVFTQNELPSFNAIRDGVAWKVIADSLVVRWVARRRDLTVQRDRVLARYQHLHQDAPSQLATF